MDSPFQVCPEISNPAAAAAAGSDGCHIIRADHDPRRTANLAPRGGCLARPEAPGRASSSGTLLSLQLNCFLSVAISTIVHASTIRPDEKRKKVIPSIPIRAPLPGIPPATTVFVPTALQCTATRSLPATVRSTVTLRSGMAARQDLLAALSCSRV